MVGEYTAEFYQNQKSGSRQSADRVVPLVIDLVGPSSVVDVGCGVGTWLAAFSNNGVLDMRGRGCSFIVFSWLSFWWLDHYSGFRAYLRAHFRCVRENDCLIAFDLRARSG